MKKKFISILLLFSLCTTTLVYADVNDDVKNAQSQYLEYQTQVDAMTGEVMSLNGQIENCVITINDNESKINSLNYEIADTENLVESMKVELTKRENLKKKRVREFYKSGGSFGYVSAFLNFKDFSNLLTKIDSVNRLISLDKEILMDIEEYKAELTDKIAKIESDKSHLVQLNDKVKEDKNIVESKKKEQEVLLVNLKKEQDKFGKEVLEVAELALIEPQRSQAESSDLNVLNNSISQLKYIRDNQLTSDYVISEVDKLVDSMSTRVSSIEAEYANQYIPTITPNRGSSDVSGMDIVNYAYQFIGSKYVWGAVGPSVFDCSGFTSYVYRHCAGIEITRTTYTQIYVGTPVSRADLQVGDLVFSYDNEHVGIYVGSGMYINATMPGDVVRVTPVTNFYAARRIL